MRKLSDTLKFFSKPLATKNACLLKPCTKSAYLFNLAPTRKALTATSYAAISTERRKQISGSFYQIFD